LVTVLGLSLSLSSGVSAADVYKCEEDGMVLFSDRPCETVVEGRALPRAQADPEETGASEQTAEARLESSALGIQEQRVREQERVVADLERELHRRMEALGIRTQAGQGGFAEAEWGNGSDAESSPVLEQYRQRIGTEREKLEELYELLQRAAR
jgi:hypothetical protein